MKAGISLFLIGAWLLVFRTNAQLPSAKLNWVFPAGFRAGTTGELTLSGSDLDEPTALAFSDPRVVATPKAGNASAFTVVVPTDMPPGLVDVRFVGRFGASNPRALAIGGRPELVVPAPNTSAATAADLPLGSVANGRAAANAAGWFRIAAKAGQRLFAVVQARELDSRLEPVLAAFTADGCELDRSRRGVLDFTAPTDGPLLLQLHDVTYRGGDDFVYRLTVTAGPHLDFALPNVLRGGETNRVTLFGRNLPGGQPSVFTGDDGRPLETLSVDVVAPISGETPVELLRRPAATVLASGSFAWRLGPTNGGSDPLLFTLTTNVVFVQEFQSSAGVSPVPAVPTQAGRLRYVKPPCEFSGLFPRRGQLSGVSFEAKKGDVFWLEVWGERLGPVCDPIALLQRVAKNDKGEEETSDVQEFKDSDANVGGREFNTATRDPAGRVEIKEDGTYRVLVRDLFNTGPTSPRHPYRLSLRRESPDFALVALPQPPPKAKDDDRQIHVATTFIRRGETVPLRVLALRRDGFNGDIELSVTNLPSGVTAAPCRVSAGQGIGTVSLSASESAAAGVGEVRVVGRAIVGANELARVASAATVVREVADYDQEPVASRLARTSAVAVSGAELAPVALLPTGPQPFEATVGGKLKLSFDVVRRGDFTGAFNVKPSGRDELDKVKETAIAEKATNAVVEVNLAEAKLPEGTHTLWVQGSVAGKYRNNPEALAAAEAELKEIEKMSVAATAADKSKFEERKKAAEEKRKTAEERAKPRDVTVMVWSRPFVVKVGPAPKPEEKK